jgi:hypothetical protein
MIDREHRIPTLMPRSGGHPLTVAVCAHPDLAVLAKWDAMVAATPQSDVTQLSAWAQLRATVGYEPLYVRVWRGICLVAGAQILYRRFPVLGAVRLGDEQDLGLLIDLIGHSASHQGYQPLSGDYLRALYRVLASAGHVVLFIGEVNGDALAAELYTACGGMLRLRLRGLDRSGEAARLSVPAAITWEAMRWAKAAGLLWFDFGGLRAPTLQALLDGGAGSSEQPSVDRFKTSFGGTPYRYPAAVEMIHSPVLRIIYDLTRQWPAGRQLIAQATRMARGRIGPLNVVRRLRTRGRE